MRRVLRGEIQAIYQSPVVEVTMYSKDEEHWIAYKCAFSETRSYDLIFFNWDD